MGWVSAYHLTDAKECVDNSGSRLPFIGREFLFGLALPGEGFLKLIIPSLRIQGLFQILEGVIGGVALSSHIV